MGKRLIPLCLLALSGCLDIYLAATEPEAPDASADIYMPVSSSEEGVTSRRSSSRSSSTSAATSSATSTQASSATSTIVIVVPDAGMGSSSSN